MMGSASINDLLAELASLERQQQEESARQRGSANGAKAGGGPASSGEPVLHEAALYGLPGDIVRAIDPCTEAHPAAVLTNTLVYFGSAAGGTAHALVGSKRHGLNLYATLVGRTAKGRKGTSMSEVDDLYGRVDREWLDQRVQSGLSSGEGLIQAVRVGSDKRDDEGKLVDPGVVDKRLLVVEEEFARPLKLMNKEGNILSAVMRQSWDSGKLRVLNKNSPVAATGAHISVIGHITEEELQRYLTDTEAGNGFANRFLWMYARRSKLLPDGGGLPHYGDIVLRLRGALDFARTCATPIRRDDEARAMWHKVYEQLSEGQAGLLGAVTSRAEAQVLRLSTVYAAMDGSQVVRPSHLLAALAVWQYSEATARRIFGQASGDSLADRIMAALKEAGEAGLDTTAIYHLFGGHKSAAQRRATLERLEQEGRLIKVEQATDGRTRIVYIAVERDA